MTRRFDRGSARPLSQGTFRFKAESTARKGFDFTAHVRRLCEDVTTRLPDMTYIDMSRIAVSFSQTRKRVRHGLWASLTPMRFADGALVGQRGDRWYQCQRLFDKEGREMFYILNFYLPRFFELSFDEKLVTLFHELWHISPRFNGDIRRHPGRCHVHTHREEEYDRRMKMLADRWMQLDPPAAIYQFLQHDFGQLVRMHGPVHGMKVPHPKLIRCDPPSGAGSSEG